MKKIVILTATRVEYGLLSSVIKKLNANLFVDISEYLEGKIKAMSIYDTELGEHPFPRSLEAIKALAVIRGQMAGCKYAEAFRIIKRIEQ